MGEFTLDILRRRRCMICGDNHKSIANVMNGQIHVATVVVCCNCGHTLTFSHSASEYAKYIEDGGSTYTTEICPDINTNRCLSNGKCPKILKGKKI